MNGTEAESALWTEEAQETLRAETRRLMEKNGLNQADVARDSGIAYGTFTSWMGGKYNGRTENVAASVRRWIDACAERARTLAVLPETPGFVLTATAQKIISVLQFAQFTPDIGVVAGVPGVGKTTALRHYRETTPNVWIWTATPHTGRVHAMLQGLCDTIGVQERSASRLFDAILHRLSGTRGLVVVDEAQHLELRAADQMRCILDLGTVGVALIGNEKVYANFVDAGKKAAYAQLFSRIGMRTTRSGADARDICQLVAAWGVTDPAEKKLLKAIAHKAGALRSLSKTLMLAGMLAVGAGEARSIKHIRQAFEQLSFSDVGVDAA